MLRWAIPFLAVMTAIEPAVSADRAIGHLSRHRTAAVILPVGLPRPHYHFRTTISYGAPEVNRRVYAQPAYAYETPELLISPGYAEVPYIAPWFGAPLLPGSSTLPGYYGSSYSYGYQGPYYGGAYVPYWDRLPYACGVYGYC